LFSGIWSAEGHGSARALPRKGPEKVFREGPGQARQKNLYSYSGGESWCLQGEVKS